MRYCGDLLDEDPRRMARNIQAHEVAYKDVTQMTDEELEARIRELDGEVRPMLGMKPIAAYKPPSYK